MLFRSSNKKRLTGKINAEEKKVFQTLPTTSEKQKIPQLYPPDCVVILFSEFGSSGIRGIKCICEMDKSILYELNNFFRKAQQNSCDVNTFLNYQQSHPTQKSASKDGRDYIHLRASLKSRVHGYMAGTDFYITGFDPNHKYDK